MNDVGFSSEPCVTLDLFRNYSGLSSYIQNPAWPWHVQKPMHMKNPVIIPFKPIVHLDPNTLKNLAYWETEAYLEYCESLEYSLHGALCNPVI